MGHYVYEMNSTVHSLLFSAYYILLIENSTKNTAVDFFSERAREWEGEYGGHRRPGHIVARSIQGERMLLQHSVLGREKRCGA
jgi:hypothetical protein